METSLQSPSIESFSYSWLANFNPSSYDGSSSFNAFDHDLEASNNFIEMDPRLPPSKRFIRVSSDFCFDFPDDSQLSTLAHADELISNGFVVPLDQVEDYYNVSSSTGTNVVVVSSSADQSVRCLSGRVRCGSLRRCRRVSKRFFMKYLAFLLRPFRKSKSMGRRNSDFSGLMSSPRTSAAYSADDSYYRRSCDSESSIIEAVLHCKRTHGN